MDNPCDIWFYRCGTAPESNRTSLSLPVPPVFRGKAKLRLPADGTARPSSGGGNGSGQDPDLVAKVADALNFGLDHVTVCEEDLGVARGSDTAGGAGQDQVTRCQCGER
jgi:CO/xanthine dehydrogenase Mo-binding subunit